MQVSQATFIKGAVAPDQFPELNLPEVGFIGRSNVGKSSLINSIVMRKNLARISSTPGKTREINFFLVQEKWVLVRSSKSYMIGEFKKIGNNWFFVPDTNTSINPNFGNDVYAGQTFSDTPDGRRIMIHWMTNFDYSGDLANVTDPYNGAFTMAYELKLKNTDEGIRLYQTSIQEYKSLRKPAHSFKKKTISTQDENILKDIKSQQFEIVATVTPATGTTQFGFNLRVGNGQLTKVYYNMRNQQLIVDRTRSGKTPNDRFAKTSMLDQSTKICNLIFPSINFTLLLKAFANLSLGVLPDRVLSTINC